MFIFEMKRYCFTIMIDFKNDSNIGIHSEHGKTLEGSESRC